jgi:PadR family transcriptional regulator, regulatory protein PadR
MGSEPRVTYQTLKVLRVFLEDVRAEFSGVELMKATGLASGSAYPILFRLEDAGLLESRWEEVDPSEAGRPRRRFYRITQRGAAFALEALLRVSPWGFPTPQES